MEELKSGNHLHPMADAKYSNNNNNNDNLSAETENAVTLPEQVIIGLILPRLPVKSLIRFKSVSKFWNSTISSTQFAKTHLNFSSASSHQFVLLPEYKYQLWFLPYNEETSDLNHPMKMDVNVNLKFPLLSFVGSSNGLVCLYNHDAICPSGKGLGKYMEPGFFTLWNPSLRQHFKIEKPNSSDWAFDFWFGHSPSTDDYKITARFKSFDDNESEHFYVFSLSTGKWKRRFGLDIIFCEGAILSAITAVFNDILYWSSCMVCKYDRVVGFNVVDEELIEAPRMDWLSKYEIAKFFVMNGCLSLYCSSFFGASHVWMLEQHDDWSSWKKMFTFYHSNNACFFLNVTTNGKFLVRSFCSQQQLFKLKVIDPSKDTQKQAQEGAFLPLPKDVIVKLAGVYVESLISPFNTINSVKEEDHELRKILDLLLHASQCRTPHCQYPKCRRVVGLFRHGIQCRVRASGGCVLCKKMWYLLQLHARACKDSDCHVPRCRDLKMKMVSKHKAQPRPEKAILP